MAPESDPRFDGKVRTACRTAALGAGLPDLMRRIDRKLDIKRGMTFTYDDLALLVTSGAYATLQHANLQDLELQCQEHVARSLNINEANLHSTRGTEGITRSSGTTGQEDASEALARAQATSKPGALRSIASTSPTTAVGQPARHAVKRLTAETS